MWENWLSTPAPARGERDSGNATGVCCSSARAQRPESRQGRACPTKRAVWEEESDWRGVARTAPSPGQRRPCPAPPRPWPPSSSHLGSPLLLPSSPALCSPKDRASPSHDSHCPASSLPGLCMGGLAPALPTHAATPATSAGGARDARPTTWPQAPLTDKAYSRLIPGTTSSRKPSVYPTHLLCSPRPRISSLGPAIPAAHRRHFRLTRPK